VTRGVWNKVIGSKILTICKGKGEGGGSGAWWRRIRRRRRRKVYSKLTQEEEEEESLFRADAINEEDRRPSEGLRT
jgi:hypothetical protein